MKHIFTITFLVFLPVYCNAQTMSHLDSLNSTRKAIDSLITELQKLATNNNSAKALSQENIGNDQEYDLSDGVPFLYGFSFTSENDVFTFIKNKDEVYTGQFKFEFFLNDLLHKGWVFPFIRNKKQLTNNTRSIFLNGQAYTPSREAFKYTTPVFGERPYASYLAAGFQRTSWWSNGFIMTTELTVGKIGAPGVGKVQNFIHEYITVNSDSVRGWHNQIAPTGKFGFSYRVYGKAPLTKESKYDKTFLRVNYDATTGYLMNYIKGGLSISNIPANQIEFINSSSSVASLTNLEKMGYTNRSGFFRNKQLFYDINIDIKAVGQNTTLQGHPIHDNSVHTIPKDRIKRLVVLPTIKGILVVDKMQISRRFVITYAANYRTAEYEGGKKGHLWGTLGLQTFKTAFRDKNK